MISHVGSNKRDPRDDEVSAVAGVIAEWDALPAYYPDWDDAAEAAAIDEGDGWIIELRYGYQTYIGSRDYTRVEGLHLGPERLARALKLAMAWRAGEVE